MNTLPSTYLLETAESMPPKAMCAKHAVPLMMRRNAKTGEVALACPYCDAEEHGGGEDERKIIEDALCEEPKKPN